MTVGGVFLLLGLVGIIGIVALLLDAHARSDDDPCWIPEAHPFHDGCWQSPPTEEKQ